MIQLTRQFSIDSDSVGGATNSDKLLGEQHEREGEDKMDAKSGETLPDYPDATDLRGTELDNTEKNNTMATES